LVSDPLPCRRPRFDAIHNNSRAESHAGKCVCLSRHIRLLSGPLRPACLSDNSSKSAVRSASYLSGAEACRAALWSPDPPYLKPLMPAPWLDVIPGDLLSCRCHPHPYTCSTTSRPSTSPHFHLYCSTLPLLRSSINPWLTLRYLVAPATTHHMRIYLLSAAEPRTLQTTISPDHVVKRRVVMKASSNFGVYIDRRLEAPPSFLHPVVRSLG
jgi:hypothetical protein